MKIEDTINALQDLIKRNNDAREGYVEAANQVAQPDLTNWLLKNGEVRGQYAVVLAQLVDDMNEEPVEGGSFLGAMHRAWMDLRAQFTQDDTHIILDECIKGEERALEDYNDIIEKFAGPEHIKIGLERQRSEIINSLNVIQKLKASYEVIEK